METPQVGLPTVELPQVAAALPEFDLPQIGERGTVRLAGRGEPGATIQLWDGDRALGTTTVGADGTWSWDGQLDPGDYSIVARTLDAAGKVTNEAPALGLNVPLPKFALPEFDLPQIGERGAVRLAGRGEPGATIQLWDGDRALGTTTVGADGTWSWDGQLDPGDHSIVARTLDAAGKVTNESAAIAVAVDAVPLLVQDATVDDQGTVTLSGTGQPGTSLEILEDGNVIGTALVAEDGTWTFTGDGTEGIHQYTVRAPDQPASSSDGVQLEVPAAQETNGEGQAYIVQQGDWLSALAQTFYGDANLWDLIYEATNARAAEDATFHAIADPNLIEPGWKLWIPAQ